MVPAFAIGRSQELLYLLAKHYVDWRLERWQVFLDSPMAIAASKVYWKHQERYDEEAAAAARELSRHAAVAQSACCRRRRTSRAPSIAFAAARIIIAGSGMANGGRILHHLKHNLGRRECHVVIVGFQAPGTLGRQLVDGLPEVRIHGQTVPCAAQIHTLGGLSAHGDQADLLRWYDSFARRPPVYLVHGELPAAEALAALLRERGATASVPPTRRDARSFEPRCAGRRSSQSLESAGPNNLATGRCAMCTTSRTSG